MPSPSMGDVPVARLGGHTGPLAAKSALAFAPAARQHAVSPIGSCTSRPSYEGLPPDAAPCAIAPNRRHDAPTYALRSSHTTRAVESPVRISLVAVAHRARY